MLSANRVAAISGVLVSVGALAAAIAGAFPGKIATAAVAVAALATKAVYVLKFLDGAQKSEARAPAAWLGQVPVTGAGTSDATSNVTTSGFGRYAQAAALRSAHEKKAEIEEPGDPDGLPGVATSTRTAEDNNDQIHANDPRQS